MNVTRVDPGSGGYFTTPIGPAPSDSERIFLEIPFPRNSGHDRQLALWQESPPDPYWASRFRQVLCPLAIILAPSPLGSLNIEPSATPRSGTGSARIRRHRRPPASCQSRFRKRSLLRKSQSASHPLDAVRVQSLRDRGSSLGFSPACGLCRRRFWCASRPFQGVAPWPIGSQRSPARRSGEFLGGDRRRNAGHAGTGPWRAGLNHFPICRPGVGSWFGGAVPIS
jgi:hypothetical protein